MRNFSDVSSEMALGAVKSIIHISCAISYSGQVFIWTLSAFETFLPKMTFLDVCCLLFFLAVLLLNVGKTYIIVTIVIDDVA